MKRRFAHIFLLLAAIQCLLGTMAAFAVSSPASRNESMQADEAGYTYVHFPGVGRYVLSMEGTTPVAQHVDAFQSAPSASRWQLVTSGSGQVLQNEDGQYLVVNTSAVPPPYFSITSEASAATAFTLMANTYYPERNVTTTTRYCLALASDVTRALGVKDGALTLVKAHSRYSVARLASTVLGVDFPLLTTEKSGTTYNMGFYYGTQVDAPYYVSENNLKAYIPPKIRSLRYIFEKSR